MNISHHLTIIYHHLGIIFHQLHIKWGEVITSPHHLYTYQNIAQ